MFISTIFGLVKILSSLSSVKSIRTCQPQPSNNGASSASRQSKADNGIYSNKVIGDNGVVQIALLVFTLYF